MYWCRRLLETCKGFRTPLYQTRLKEIADNHILNLARKSNFHIQFYRSTICDRIPSVISWHRNFTGISKVLHENYQLVTEKYLCFKNIFPQPRIVAFRRNKKYKRIINHYFWLQKKLTLDFLHSVHWKLIAFCNNVSQVDSINNHKRSVMIDTESRMVYAAECVKQLNKQYSIRTDISSGMIAVVRQNLLNILHKPQQFWKTTWKYIFTGYILNLLHF